ncbi:hypothetical protein GCM10027169_37260 [Gordonia jinhuaensis]|uniref:Uncharacterized protein n=1 Tax=Gordonia jinhuaensis TaxID=1517702 RepID=A0A916T3F1_9ACTN|nr:hypothetical protein [Gordonia jinhuaensis]GGB26377.1 hypothetical protein GCM10011489_13170 [Gordonia jinhuaensis]
MSTTAPAPTPASYELTPGQWSSKLAALASRGVSETDPRVRWCREALSYWRIRRVLDVEAPALSSADRADLQLRLDGGRR